MSRNILFNVGSVVVVAALLSVSCINNQAQAGVVIMAGTDADDHGGTSMGANVDGWFFMQRALESIGTSAGLTNGNKKVVTLGSSAGTALSAATSAFTLSSLPGAGWTFASVDGVTGISDFFGGVGPHTVGNTGIFMVDSTFVNVGGGITALEDAALTANAAGIDSFIGSGGGAFTQSHSYGWLSTLIPGLTTTSFGGGGVGPGLALTAAGTAAFPGLTNADLSSGPWHSNFGGALGGLSIFATSTVLGPTFGTPVIIGTVTGSITNPGVPEPTSILVWSLLAVGTLTRRSRSGNRSMKSTA